MTETGTIRILVQATLTLHAITTRSASPRLVKSSEEIVPHGPWRY